MHVIRSLIQGGRTFVPSYFKVWCVAGFVKPKADSLPVNALSRAGAGLTSSYNQTAKWATSFSKF